MKRYAMVRLGDYENEGTLVPKLNLYPGISSRLWYGPGREWVLCQFGAPSLDGIATDPDIYILPDAPLDLAVSAIATSVRNALKAKLVEVGYQDTFSNTWSYRQLLNFILHQVQPDITIEMGDVQDLYSN